MYLALRDMETTSVRENDPGNVDEVTRQTISAVWDAENGARVGLTLPMRLLRLPKRMRLPSRVCVWLEANEKVEDATTIKITKDSISALEEESVPAAKKTLRAKLKKGDE